MGIYDRDYWQDSPRRSSAFGGLPAWSVTTWLIVINVAVFLLNDLIVSHEMVVDSLGNVLGQLTVNPIYDWGYFSVTQAFYHVQLWRLISFQFLHAGVEHILFNMIALFFFGPLVESFWGARRYLAFYLLCGIAGPIMYTLFWSVGFLIHNPNVPLIGASAGIFGVLIGGALIAPDATVLIWGIIPARLRVVAWLLLAYAAYVVLFNGNNAGGQAAHLGGAAAGYILIRNPRWLDFVKARRRPRMRLASRNDPLQPF